MNDYRAAAGRKGKEFRMRDKHRSPVRHPQRKRAKRQRSMGVAKLFDGHAKTPRRALCYPTMIPLILMASKSRVAAFTAWLVVVGARGITKLTDWEHGLKNSVALFIAFVFGPATSGFAAADLTFAHGLYRQGRYQLGADEYRQFLRDNPNDALAPEARFYLAECLTQLQKPAEAQRLYDELAGAARRGSPYYRDGLLRGGEARQRGGDFPAAIERLGRFAKEFRGDADEGRALVGLGESQLAVGNPNHAAPNLDRAEELIADRHGALYGRLRLAQGKAAQSLDRTDQARRRFQEVAGASEQPLAADAQFALALLEFDGKRFTEAAAAFDDLVRRFPQSPLIARATLNQALCLQQLGQHGKAVPLLERMLQSGAVSGDDAAEAAIRLGQSYRQFKQPARAADVLEKAAHASASSPRRPELRFHAALAALDAGLIERAESGLASFLVDFPNHSLVDQALYYRGRVAHVHRDPSAVAATYERLARDFAKSPWRQRAAVTVAETIVADAAGQRRSERLAELVGSLEPGTARQQVAYLVATALFEETKLDAAAEWLREILVDRSEEPVRGQARYLLGVVFAKQGKWEDAIAPLAEFLESARATPVDNATELAAIKTLGEAIGRSDATQLDAWANRLQRRADAAIVFLDVADRLFADKRWQAAEQLAERASNSSRFDAMAKARAILLVGWSRLERGQTEAAAVCFRRATALGVADPKLAAEALYMTGVAWQRIGKQTEAVAAFEQLRREHSHSPHALDADIRLSQLLAGIGKLDEAEKLLDDLAGRVKNQPDRLAAILFERAWLSLKRQRAAEAATLFRQVAEQHPTTSFADEALLKLAEIAQDRQDYSQAERWLSMLDAKKYDGRLLPAVSYRRASLAFRQRDFDRAAGLLTGLLERSPDDPLAAAALVLLGEIDLERQRPDAALARFRSAIASRNAGVHGLTARLRVSQCLLVAKKWRAANESAAKFLTDHPTGPLAAEALFVQGRALQQEAQFDEARQKFDRATTLDNGETAAKARFMSGETFFHQRRYPEALKDYLKVDILYEYPAWQSVAMLQAGKCHEQLDERRAAVQAYRRLLDRFAEQPSAKQAKERLEALEGNR